MARRTSKRMKDAAARRRQIESPPRRRAADARASQRGAVRRRNRQGLGHLRLVPCHRRGPQPRTCAQVVLGFMPAPRLGAETSRGLGALGHRSGAPARRSRAHRHEGQASGRRRTSDRDTTDRRRVGPPARGAGRPARPRHDLRPSTVGDAPGRRRRRRLLQPTMELTPATSLRQRTNDRLGHFRKTPQTCG
jgi:hypothetical protein